MQRHQRRNVVETTVVEVAVVRAASAARATPGPRRAVSLLAVLLTLVIVASLTLAVASTIVAVRAANERTRARDELAKATHAVDQCLVTAATHKDLKGLKMEPVRKELLQNALAYYQDYVAAHANDQPPTPEVAAAYFRIAAVQAKLGSVQSVPAFNQSIIYVDKMKAAKVDPESYPSVQETAMKLAAPNEWVVIKGASFEDLPKHAFKLFIAMQGAALSYEQLCKEYPEAVSPRDNLSVILKAMAMLQSSARGRSKQALAAWLRARDLLDTLVRDRPDNADYKARLAECLVGAAKLQKAANDSNAAVSCYEQAIEIRKQLAAAKPDDKAIADELAAAQKELAKIKPAEPKEPAPEKAEAAAPPESSDQATPGAALAERPTAPDAAAEKEPAPAAEKEPAPAEPAEKEPAPPVPSSAEPAAAP